MRIELDDKELQATFKRLIDKSPKIAEDVVTEVGAIAHKAARSAAPVDTGRLKGSIDLQVNKSGVSSTAIVGTNLEYAPYVEYGTSRQPAQPFIQPARDEAAKEMIKIARGLLE